MGTVLIWIGIALIVIGWLALAWQASKRLSAKAEAEKFPQKKKTMRLYRSYCLLTIFAGMAVLLVAIFI